MRRGRWAVLAVGLVLAVAGAVLAFALQPGEPANWTALGVIVLVAGLAVTVTWGASEYVTRARSALPGQVGQDAQAESAAGGAGSRGGGADRALSGLLAVVSGIAAVVILGVVTLGLLREGADKSSTVAVATSAFGVISAVVGAYLGVKIGAEQGQVATAAAGAQTKEVAEAAREATAQARQTVEAAGAQNREVADAAREATEQAKQAADAAREAAGSSPGGATG